MGTKSKGRGAAATFGLLLVLAGVAGAVALWVMADRRPEQAVDGFARGPVGCTTTLEFGDTGTFYVYAEIVDPSSDAFAECSPDATSGAEFGFVLLDGDRSVAPRDDSSISYDTTDAIGASVARIEIDDPGRYDLVVEGPDPNVVAAVGRDPDLGVADLRRGAIVVGGVGIVLGALMLLLAGRRSRRAATFATPDGPGWGPQPTADRLAPAWPPEPPRVPQVPINPTLPPEPVPADSPTESVPADSPAQPTAAQPPASSPWGPPLPSERQDPPPPA